MIKIYNTLTRQKETFKPLEAGKVKMYVCGPTVYNYIHIGNARSSIAFDTIRRYLNIAVMKSIMYPTLLMWTIKLLKRPKKCKSLHLKWRNALSMPSKPILNALNIKEATLNPRVMDHIEDIIDFVQVLVDKGYAYESNGDVYYRTRKFKDYGKLSDQSIDELEIGASQRTGSEQAQKEDPLDFALWKKAKEGEISWDSPWGKVVRVGISNVL